MSARKKTRFIVANLCRSCHKISGCHFNKVLCEQCHRLGKYRHENHYIVVRDTHFTEGMTVTSEEDGIQRDLWFVPFNTNPVRIDWFWDGKAINEKIYKVMMIVRQIVPVFRLFSVDSTAAAQLESLAKRRAITEES